VINCHHLVKFSQPRSTKVTYLRLVLVDRDARSHRAIATRLKALPQPWVLESCFSASEGLRCIVENVPDVVLLDPTPGPSGLECLRGLRAALPRLPVLVHSAGCGPEWGSFGRRPAAAAESLVEVRPWAVEAAGNARTTKWDYDLEGRLGKKYYATDLTNPKLTYTYFPTGCLSNRWSSAKGTTLYLYDAVGSLTNVDYPSSPDVRFQYDAPVDSWKKDTGGF
jgi:hypothetical protein